MGDRSDKEKARRLTGCSRDATLYWGRKKMSNTHKQRTKVICTQLQTPWIFRSSNDSKSWVQLRQSYHDCRRCEYGAGGVTDICGSLKRLRLLYSFGHFRDLRGDLTFTATRTALMQRARDVVQTILLGRTCYRFWGAWRFRCRGGTLGQNSLPLLPCRGCQEGLWEKLAPLGTAQLWRVGLYVWSPVLALQVCWFFLWNNKD